MFAGDKEIRMIARKTTQATTFAVLDSPGYVVQAQQLIIFSWAVQQASRLSPGDLQRKHI